MAIPTALDADAMLHVDRGVAWPKEHEIARAIGGYGQAPRFDPNSVSAYGNRGNVWSDKGESASLPLT
jgi:hypothetical protein